MECNINDQNFQYTGNRTHKKDINIVSITKSYLESREANVLYIYI